MKCVVTGAAGFIGSHLCQALLRSGHEVVGLDSFVPSYPVVIKQRNLLGFLSAPNCRFYRIDLRKDRMDDLLAGAEVVFHLAAMAGPACGWTDVDKHWASDVKATQKLLEAVHRSAGGLRRFVFASSSAVYGSVAPTDEAAPTRPLAPCGIIKLAGENLCLAYATALDVPVVILRYCYVYGPRQRPDLDYHRYIEGLLLDRPVVVYGDGHETRGDVYVGDCVRATVAAVEAPPGEIYNVGGEAATTREVLHKLEALAGRPARVRQEPARPGDPRQGWLNTTKLHTHLGWEPRTGLDEGLARQWAWQTGELQDGDDLVARGTGRAGGGVRKPIVRT